MSKKFAVPQHQIAARVGGDTYHALTAVAAILGHTQADVLDKSLAAFVATLPAETRRAVAVAMKAGREHCPTCKR